MTDSSTDNDQSSSNALLNNKSDLTRKLELFNEYFTIEQDVNVNVIPMEKDFLLPNFDQFIRDMPYSFRLASEVSTLEASSIRPLRNLGSIGDELVEFLKAQSRKIDLIMSYILTMEDEDQNRLVTKSFGGGGVSVISETALPVGQVAQLKLFLTEEASAIFCYGEVVKVEKLEAEQVETEKVEVKQESNTTDVQADVESGDKYLISLYYARIREEDRELIVRASLHQQSKQLKRKAETKRR